MSHPYPAQLAVMALVWQLLATGPALAQFDLSCSGLRQHLEASGPQQDFSPAMLSRGWSPVGETPLDEIGVSRLEFAPSDRVNFDPVGWWGFEDLFYDRADLDGDGAEDYVVAGSILQMLGTDPYYIYSADAFCSVGGPEFDWAGCGNILWQGNAAYVGDSRTLRSDERHDTALLVDLGDPQVRSLGYPVEFDVVTLGGQDYLAALARDERHEEDPIKAELWSFLSGHAERVLDCR